MRFARSLGPALLAALGGSLLSGHARAQQATTTFNVTATILPACTVRATDLNFGTYAQAQVDQTSTITVTCTNTTEWEVGLSAGNSLSIASRHMTGPGPSNLDYNLFTTAGRTIVWGDHPALPGQDAVSGVGTGNAQPLTVYGRIPAGQQKPDPGNFIDTITVTITF